ncbi:MAG: alpha-amylase family glycosyl hydrolase [Clostridia bacterium]
MPRSTQSSQLIALDPWLAPYEKELNLRVAHYQETRKRLLQGGEKLRDFANGASYYGFHRTEGGWVYREWAPAASALCLFGDFNGWNRTSHPLTRLANGDWEISLEGENALQHEQHVLVSVTHADKVSDHIPLYIRRVVQDVQTHRFTGQIWEPPVPFHWTDTRFRIGQVQPWLIYECHVGMAQSEEKVGSYAAFTEKILPRIKAAGYQAIQLMAVMEHPYYGSFGYQVTNFFAASSWFGTPEELKALINQAHRMGLAVLLDLVHAHASANTAEGIANFDGTDVQFFHAGQRGHHSAWGSRVLDYAQPGVLHFLLSNVKFWLQEYHFDGFRFDGVTSMLYLDHGIYRVFDGYDAYFGPNTDLDAVAYLMLANELIHSLKHSAVTIAEDVSGMPGLCRPLAEGGMGFQYRLGMGVPDFWIRTLKERRDEAWDLHQMWHELTTRRPGEPVIGYSESHDQALVGDQTLIFRLADSEMYDHMEKTCHTPVIDRAIALLKLIRFITLTLAGEGYLNFMGNEFGHPEWVDFPREGNGWSYRYARRQWALADNDELKYAWIAAFDRAMLDFVKQYAVLSATDTLNLWIDPERKLLAYRKAGLVFVFNLHPTLSQADFFLPLRQSGVWQVIFSTDEPAFGGDGRIDRQYQYHTREDPRLGVGFAIYVPCRTAMALQCVDAQENPTT